MNGNCCALGTGPIDAVGCGVLLLPIAVDAAWDKFWACACAAAARFETTAAAARYSNKHVAGVRSRKSHGCSSDCGDNCSSFDLRPERKAKMRFENYFLCIMFLSIIIWFFWVFFSSLQLFCATITLFYNNDHRENYIKLFFFLCFCLRGQLMKNMYVKENYEKESDMWDFRRKNKSFGLINIILNNFFLLRTSPIKLMFVPSFF